MSPNGPMDGVKADPAALLAIQYNELMKNYIKERIDQPYNGDLTTSKYVRQAIDILDAAARALGTIDKDHAASFEDALLLTKCFHATVLEPPQLPDRMAAFLDFVHTVQPDMSRFQPDVVSHIRSESSRSVKFWELLKHFILTGLMEDAYQLLASRDSDPQQDQAYENLIQLIQSYPLKTSKQSSFMRWRQNALAALNNLQDYKTSPSNSVSNDSAQIEQINLLLLGDLQVTLRSADNWVEALCGLTLYSDPTFEALEINFSAAYEKLGLVTVPTWEEGCKALFEDRVVAALGSFRLLDLGTAVVFSEFCNEKNLLRKYAFTDQIHGTDDSITRPNGGIREELGLEYVQELLSKTATVEIGLEMLANIANDAARSTAQEALPKLVRRMPSKVKVAIDTADQLGLADLGTLLSKTAAESHWAAHHYIPALIYFYLSGDYTSLNICSWDLFEQILVTQEVPLAILEDGDDEDANPDNVETLTVLRDYATVDELDLAPLVRDSIAPAAVLLQLLSAIRAEDIISVIDNLRGLLALPSSRHEYYPLLVALLGNVVPGALSTEDTVMLMDALDVWDRASPEIKRKSRDLIVAASQQPNWQQILDIDKEDDYDNAVWFLRRQLAKSIVL